MTLQEQGYLKCLGMPRSQLLEDHRGGNALLCSVLMRQDGEHSERRVRKQEAHARIPSPNSFSFSICSVISTLQCLHTQLCNFGLASIQVFWVQPAYAASFFFFFSFFLSHRFCVIRSLNVDSSSCPTKTICRIELSETLPASWRA